MFCAGGLWDTKHLVRQLPESFPRLPSTSLGPLYEALVEGDLALEVCHNSMLCVYRIQHAGFYTVH